MKSKVTIILALLVFAPYAQAGLFDFLQLPFSSGPSPEAQNRYFRSITSEVPIYETCEPAFAPGNDGIFRRTAYCHKTNPGQPSGFMAKGLDVPATFLKGYTEDDVLNRWKGARFQVPEFLGSRVEVPAELFVVLNTKAAQTWESILACANGDADRAREMYRTGSFICDTSDATAQIREQVVDLRQSLPTLAASLEVALFFDGKRFEERAREITARLEAIRAQVRTSEVSPEREEYFKLLQAESQIMRLRLQATLPGMGDISILETYVPHMPRMHPLLTQIMYEELLSLVAPEESARSVARRLEKNSAQRVYLMQLLLWGNSIEERECSPLGLWPSANRAAIEAFSDKSFEIQKHLGGPDLKPVRLFMVVACPSNPFSVPNPRSAGASTLPTSELARQVMRLNDVYLEGRHTVWREIRELRERYVGKDSQ